MVSFTADSASLVALEATIVNDLFASANHPNVGHERQQSVAIIIFIPTVTDLKHHKYEVRPLNGDIIPEFGKTQFQLYE